MAYRKDNAPVGNTCPDIDEAKRHIEKATSYMRSADEYLIDLLPVLEKLRNENDQLRTWGNEQFELAEEYEAERDELKKYIDSLNDEVYELKQQINKLENAEI